jgi:hypothetical protein
MKSSTQPMDTMQTKERIITKGNPVIMPSSLISEKLDKHKETTSLYPKFLRCFGF